MPNETPTYAYRVTAIVSVYKAERFMRACLEDLERQTIFAQTEVIIIDACSPENEGAIVRQFMERHPNIVYVRTPERETLYASWNRAIGMARGQYLTNANADDRHAPHCFERLAAELDTHPNVGMAYAQCRVTGEINALFESAPIKRRLHWLPYDHLNFMRRCEAGPQPMWRAAVHNKVGLFDDTCTVVGDHDMWLRISELYPLRYVPEELGLYLEYDSNLESSNPQRAYDEEMIVKQRALQRFMSPNFKPHVPFSVQQQEHAAALARLLDDVRNGRPVRDLNELEHHFYAYAALAARDGDRTTALEILDMFFSIINNSKNICHLYRFLLCSSQGADTGQLRVEPAKDLPPLVSVVIPLYNQGQFLATAVASVLAQTEPRWEMCIINDGSTDNSLALAKEVLASYNDPRIRLVSQPNAGKGPTRNRGVRETTAPFVCVLDADDMLVPTYFREALDSLKITPDAGWICPRTLVFGGNNHVIWSEPYDFFRSLLQCPCPVTAIYRRAVWDELGGYVESMIDREDWEFWVRAGEAGWTGLTTPTVQFIYRHAFQRFGQQPIPNLRSKQEYIALHEWWFRALPPKELRARLMAYSVGILPEDMLNPHAVEAVRPFVGQRQAFKKAVDTLKTATLQATPHTTQDTAQSEQGPLMPKANTICPAKQPMPSHRYVTYFDKNYLAKGLTLITSLQEHDPLCQIDVVCLDKETRQALLRLNMPTVRPIDIHRIEKNDPELDKIRSERSDVEYYWSLTPTIILRLLENMPQGEVLTYLDADLYFWSSPQPVFDEMKDADVLIHEHNFSPDLQYLEKFGLYNVGLMCFRASEEGFAVLRWWRKKCLEWCGNYIDDDPEGGTRYGDQKYLERFQSISSAVRVCKHPGVGVAAWNHVKFSLSHNPAGQLCVDGQPAIMYHYHSFAILAPGCALPSTKAYPLTSEIIRLFHIPYLEAWEKAHTRIRAVLPNFTEGFSPQALMPDRCVLACAKQADTFRNEGLTDAVPLQNSRGEAYTLFIAPYLRAMMNARPAARRTSPSLEASLANYQRFTQKPRLLNLGCGSHHHAAWLNVDIAPSTPGVHAVDLRGDWPLPENFFDVVYHSHVLEHMSQAQGTEYLRKCFAVLKPGGVLRVAVPDLEAIARNYIAALDSARQGTPGAEHRHAWMLLELIDQMARHHSGGGMAEYFKQVPLPEAAFVFERIGREGEHLAQALQGKAPRTHEESDPLRVGAFRLGGEVHRWMYDPWSLRRALETAGFTDITHVDAVTSAWPDFASFNLDADSAGRTRKPDSLFMEARKGKNSMPIQEKQGDSGLGVAARSCHILETPPKSPLFWSGAFATWQSAVQAAGGYDTEEIFVKVRNAARAVRDGLALWERDSVLFHKREYNMPLVEALLNVAKNNSGKLHVLDFGGALGSTYHQNKAAFAMLNDCTWNVVEQKHVVECGKAEFSDGGVRFFYSMEEALKENAINVIVFSGVLQFLEAPYAVLRQATKTGLPIVFDRTSVLADQECITVQHVPEVIYKASYAYRWLNLRTIEAIFAQHGYTLAPWWQSAVDPEGFIGTVAHKVPPAKHKKEPSAVETTTPLRVMQADWVYSAYLGELYAKHPDLARKSHAEQTHVLFKDGFNAIHSIAPYLDTMGCRTDYFVLNAGIAQAAWARENSIPVPPVFDASAEQELLRRRIEWFKPDVLYIVDPVRFDASFLASLSFRPRCIVGWRAADIPFGTDWTGYDIMLSGLPRLLALAESLGAKKGVLFHPGMPSWVARAVENIPQDTDVVFVGSISPTQHVRRVALLDTVAQAATQHGFSFAAHLLCNPACLTPALRPYVHPPAFGLDMHKALRRGRIVIDDRAHHGLIMPDGSKKLDLGGEDTSNMRLFEGTGGGSLVLTEALPGVARYFEPDKEAVLYTSHADAVAKILYYLEHEQERAAIAAAGKARCLGEHNINVRARAFLELVRNAL